MSKLGEADLSSVLPWSVANGGLTIDTSIKLIVYKVFFLALRHRIKQLITVNGQTDRHRGRRTNKQTEGQAGGQIDRKAGQPTDGPSDRDKQSPRHTFREIDRQIDRQTDKQRVSMLAWYKIRK